MHCDFNKAKSVEGCVKLPRVTDSFRYARSGATRRLAHGNGWSAQWSTGTARNEHLVLLPCLRRRFRRDRSAEVRSSRPGLPGSQPGRQWQSRPFRRSERLRLDLAVQDSGCHLWITRGRAVRNCRRERRWQSRAHPESEPWLVCAAVDTEFRSKPPRAASATCMWSR